ncbi:MAG: DUF1501 domain-containing protein [Chthoniobacter sp.]|uniref:DUF1501 domain-containing protein n=1 Tax=Chthoniobacter sp. TaxID=2510640 RepID=UPI0032A55F3E
MSHFACSNFNHAVSRRHALKVGGLGLLGLNFPQILNAVAYGTNEKIKPTAKSVIFLFQWGGPSHIDMFDMKPDAPEGIRGPHKPISSKADGIQVSEHLPKMAKVMDKVTLIRSMHHTMKNHNSAGYYALTGHAPPSDDQRLRDSLDLFPGYSSIVDKLSPLQGDLPTSVSYPYVISDGSVTPGQHASFLGKDHDPLTVLQDPNSSSFTLPELSLPVDIPFERMQARRELQQLIDQQARLLEISPQARGFDGYYDRAIGMLQSPKLREAFNLAAEPEKVREAYGRTTYGQSCLLARRLVEAGTKFVTAYFAPSIGGQSTTEGGWDTHGFNNTRMFPIIEKYHLPMTEQTLPTLLIDLEERGLLDTTLVVWMGEFGRTPNINKNVSRDHWPMCYTTLLAGGGVKRGFVYGASDKQGAYPAENPVRPDDLAATIYAALGIDPHTELRSAAGRPVLAADGKPVTGIFA